ncbi:MAG: efflux RND transporter periplasmic adaptor subunit [Bacteroidales bacterium]|nr:efflux RND transporter periplasmic adaptor subunit [Bacteroidales bacterium]
MTAEQNSIQSDKGSISTRKTVLISLLILLVGGAVTLVVFLTEPKAVRSGATRETAMLVDVIRTKRDTFQPTIVAMGTVKPSQDIILRPRVSGQITDRYAAFTPGGYVNKGEILLQIDPEDYKNTLEQRKSELQQAKADLNIEMGRQDVAQSDYQLLDEELSDKNKKLILREPQLNSAKSRVEAAQAAVDQAELNLQRTTIEAPFDAHILSRNVNVGSQVSPGDNLGHLVGIENYWVEATVPVDKLQRLTFPDGGGERGSEVMIRNRTAWEEGKYRKGYLHKLIGSLEDQTRMARVLITVPDPLGRRTGPDDLPVLMIGSFVEANIKAEQIPDVIRLNRDYVRKNETVWVMEDEELRIRDVNIVFRDAQYAYISGGMSEDAQVVITNLTTVAEGARLRLEGDTAQTRDSLATRNQ